MDRVVIKAEDVRKRYRLGVIDRTLLAEELAAMLARVRGRKDPRTTQGGPAEHQRMGDHFWSLRGVTFDVHGGDVLGLVGRNGAGKSTLLKLLSRITLPTVGRISMRGRVSSLLEVGTGFHPELTGRENIYLNGAIMGMRRYEIDRKLDEIIDFSGIEHHIDTPIKRYSSGMKVRLGFAVAAHLDPEILIVDEVLAVGDAEFQRKCLGSMRSVADSGRTIIFVSHSMVSIQSLCGRAIWLDKGLIRRDGPTDQVVQEYLAEYSAQTHEQEWTETEGPGNDELRVLSIKAISDHEDGSFWISGPIRIEIEFNNHRTKEEDLDIRLLVRTSSDILAFVSDMSTTADSTIWPTGRNKVTCIIPADLLNDGGYRIELHFISRGKLLFKIEEAITIEVQEGARTGTWFHKWQGALRPKVDWTR